MQTTNLNPRNFKTGTVIVTTSNTYTVERLFKSSIHAVSKYEGKIKAHTLPYSIFDNKMFMEDLVSVTEPLEAYSPEYVDFKAETDLSNIEEY